MPASRDAVRAAMEAGGAFTLAHECDVPFVILEHARKFQVCFARVSVRSRVRVFLCVGLCVFGVFGMVCAVYGVPPPSSLNASLPPSHPADLASVRRSCGR